MFVLCLKSIILETNLSFEEQQNGLYGMLLSVAAMFYVCVHANHVRDSA